MTLTLALNLTAALACAILGWWLPCVCFLVAACLAPWAFDEEEEGEGCDCPCPGYFRGCVCRAKRTGLPFQSDDWCNCACHRESAAAEFNPKETNR